MQILLRSIHYWTNFWATFKINNKKSNTNNISDNINNSKSQRPSWEANSRSTGQKLPSRIWNPNVHYTCPSRDQILSQINPVYEPNLRRRLSQWIFLTFTFCTCESHYNIFYAEPTNSFYFLGMSAVSLTLFYNATPVSNQFISIRSIAACTELPECLIFMIIIVWPKLQYLNQHCISSIYN
jgi:hypothetical protein